MAHYNQSKETLNAPLEQDQNGRGGHYNRGRGKGRGGYNGGNRGRAQQSGNYGPRTVPNPKATSFEPFPPAPWGMKYGRHSQPPLNHLPDAPGQWVQPADTYYDPAMLQPPNVSGGHFVPLYPATHTSTPARTPIVTTASNIATPTTENMPSPTVPNDRVMTSVSMTQARDEPGTNNKDAIKVLDSRPVATTIADTQEAALAASHIHAPVPKRVHNITSITPESVINEFVPQEGQNAGMDADHNTPEATVKLLDYNSLMRLQVFNITLARKLQNRLEGVRKAHEEQDHGYRKKRSVLLSLLLAARDTERSYEFDIQRLQDRFCHKMEEACKLDGEAKNNAQLNATVYLKSATDISQLATEQREKIEQYRNNLSDLDNARAISRNKYSDAVHEVLMNALGGAAIKKHAAMSKEVVAVYSGVANAATASKKSSVDMARAQDDRKDSGAATLPQMAYLNTKQPVFERQPESEHQSIGEVLHRSNTSNAHEIYGPWAKDNERRPAKDKEHPPFPSKSQLTTSPATLKHAIATLNAAVEDWTPESLKHLVSKRDDTTAVVPPEAKTNDTKDKTPAQQEAAGDKAKNKVPPQPPAKDPKDKSKDKSMAPAVSAPKSNPSGKQGTVRKKFNNNKSNKKKGGKNNESGINGGTAHATPKAGPAAGPPAGEMRKGG